MTERRGIATFVRRELQLLAVAVQFLTRLPTPRLAAYEERWLSLSARYFPLVGVLVGVINVAIWRGARMLWSPTVSIGLMLAASLLVTGAFHEDGFVDACDGFGGASSPRRVLEIMKDSRIGAYGALGAFMMLGLKWAVLTDVPLRALPLVVISAHMVSRWCAIGLLCFMPYVRSDDDAKSKPFARGLSVPGWITSGALGVCAVAGITMFSPGAAPGQIRTLIPAALTALLVASTSAIYVKQRIGGYTGDCLGAVQQVSELGFLLSAAAAPGGA